MRRAARIDTIHPDIVDALRQIGAHVTSLAAVGCGCPDLLVGFTCRTVLLEVKDGSRPPSERNLTAAQTRWLDTWTGGSVHIVQSVDQAIEAVTMEWKKETKA